jgi:xanthine phosphoribosyltransferase
MKYDYEKFVGELDYLIKKIIPYKPDIILSVARGGVTLGHFISVKMGIRELYSLNSIHYDDKRKLNKVLLTNIPKLGAKKNVLIVDDIIDSGESMVEILKVLNDKYPNNSYKVATIFYKKDALIQPDFRLHEAKEWIEFFWEVD